MHIQTINIIKYLKQTIMKMSEYILSLLQANNICIMWSWGANNFETLYDEYNSDMGLKFKVNGHHHKGFVEVFYDRCYDLFKVTLKDDNDTIIEVIDRVYFDEIQNLIDKKVEYIEDYQN